MKHTNQSFPGSDLRSDTYSLLPASAESVPGGGGCCFGEKGGVGLCVGVGRKGGLAALSLTNDSCQMIRNHIKYLTLTLLISEIKLLQTKLRFFHIIIKKTQTKNKTEIKKERKSLKKKEKRE